VAIAISSLPIVVVVLVIVTGPAPGADLTFLIGWLVGLAAVGGLVIALADVLLSDASQPRWANPLRILLGVLLLFLAAKQWRGRGSADDVPSAPGWMASLDEITAPRALGLGFLLGSLNPKNALLMVSGAASVVAETAVAHEQVVALVVLVAIASTGVAAPVVAHRGLGDPGRAALDKTKAWLAEHNAVVMTVVLLVLGTVLLGNGLGGLG
jgi:threonine/homoserine/homoserine lactone efflux protein